MINLLHFPAIAGKLKTLILRNIRNHLDFHKVFCKRYANRSHPNLMLLTRLELVITRWTHQAVRTHISSSYFIVHK